LGDPQRSRVVGLRAGQIAFDVPLADPELPARLGALFGVEMDAVQGREQRFILPRARSAG